MIMAKECTPILSKMGVYSVVKRALYFGEIAITYRCLVLLLIVTHPQDLPHSFATFALEREEMMNCCDDEITC